MPMDIARVVGIGSFVIVLLLSDGRCSGFMTCDQRGRGLTLELSEQALAWISRLKSMFAIESPVGGTGWSCSRCLLW